jgi:hypothetical protein
MVSACARGASVLGKPGVVPRWAENAYVKGRLSSGSDQPIADIVKLVSRAMPVRGVAERSPPRGGEFTLMMTWEGEGGEPRREIERRGGDGGDDDDDDADDADADMMMTISTPRPYPGSGTGAPRMQRECDHIGQPRDQQPGW